MLDENYNHKWQVQFALGIRSSSQEKVNLNIMCSQFYPLIFTLLGSPMNTEYLMISNLVFSSNSEIINTDRYESYYSDMSKPNFMDKLKIKQLSIVSNTKLDVENWEPI